MKSTFVLLCAALLSAGCFSSKKAPVSSTPRNPAKFDFAPPSREKAGASTMSIALVKPKYITETPEYYIQPFPEMASSMSNDFEELLTAKGFTIRGPFASRDAMLYNDKQTCSFAFQVEIDLQPNYNRKYKYEAGLGSIIPAHYKMNGEITLGGTLVLTASSPQYGEKIWKKNIALDKSVFTYNSSMKWNGIPTVAEELQQDNYFYNTFARELEKFYEKALNLAWQQIDPAEMLTVADQAKKADKKQ